MHISDWSSDVCSSDLDALVPGPGGRGAAASRAHAVDSDGPVLRLAGDRAVHPDHLHPDFGPGPQQPQPGATAGHDAAGHHRGLGSTEQRRVRKEGASTGMSGLSPSPKNTNEHKTKQNKL